MAEQKESSVLFSLKELMNLEEDRIRAEEAEKEARLERGERRAAKSGPAGGEKPAASEEEADAREAAPARDAARLEAIHGARERPAPTRPAPRWSARGRQFPAALARASPGTLKRS
jgi:predicted phage gp36 major capsid-like protein